MKVIIHWLKIVLRTVDNPVSKGGPADLGPILFPVFLLPVKGKPIGIFLVHGPCNGGCRGRTFPNQSRRNLGLYDYRFFCVAESFLAGWASVALAVVFDYFTSGRNEFQFPADILLANQNQLRTAYRTNLLFFRKREHYFFNLKAFEEIFMRGLLFTGMFLDYSFFFRQRWILFHFRFIKEILLSRNIIGSSFTGRTKEFFCQIIYLFLKGFLVTGFFVNNKTERFHHLSLFRYHCFQL